MHGNPDIALVGPGRTMSNHRGRPKGVLNHTTRAAREFAARVISDSEYQADILRRARTGQLGSFEPTLWAYAAGKPPADLTLHFAELISDADALTTLSAEELAQPAVLLAEAIRASVQQHDVVEGETLPAQVALSDDEAREALVRLLAEATPADLVGLPAIVSGTEQQS